MVGRFVKLLLTKRKGAKMAELLCDHCGSRREINHRLATNISGEGKDSIEGALKCRRCGKKTIFGMIGNAISFYPSKRAFGALSENTPQEIRDIFTDAELCFYGLGYRGAIAMSRACVERSLSLKGITKGKLEERIDEAKGKDILTETEYMLAHGSRLAGNAALHKAETIAPSDVPTVLSAVVSIINHLF